MRILVVSDSHGVNSVVGEAVQKAGKIDCMFHLGDVGLDYHEVEGMAGVPTYIVSGNSDYIPELHKRVIIDVGGHRIYATHGHENNVEYTLDNLRYNAIQNDCDIALFGHTHKPFLEINEGDVTFANPGSIMIPRQEDKLQTFLIIEIDEKDEVTYTFDHI